MRTPPSGTYPVGKLGELSLDYTVKAGVRKVQSAEAYHTGKQGGVYLQNIPYNVNYADLERGKDRYAVYCTPCHGAGGYGNGAVADRARGKLMPSNFHAQPTECTPTAALQAERSSIVKMGEGLLASKPAPSADEAAVPAEPTPAEGEAPIAGEPPVPPATADTPDVPPLPAWQNEETLGAEMFARLTEIDTLLADPYMGCTEGSICVENKTDLVSDPRMLEGQCQRSLGYIYHVITNGIRSMKPYKAQMDDPSDRWAVAAYVRALQISQAADRNSVVDFLSAQNRGVKTQSSVLKALEGGKPHIFNSNQSFEPVTGAKK